MQGVKKRCITAPPELRSTAREQCPPEQQPGAEETCVLGIVQDALFERGLEQCRNMPNPDRDAVEDVGG